MFFLDTEGYESPGRARMEFPIEGVCCSTGSSEDAARAGHGIERRGDKALSHLKGSTNRAKPRGQRRDGLGGACGTKQDS